MIYVPNQTAQNIEEMHKALEAATDSLKRLFYRATHITTIKRFITKRELERFPLGQLQDLPGAPGVSAKRLPLPGSNSLYYELSFQAGALLGPWMLEKDVSFYIDQGKLYDMTSAQRLEKGKDYQLQAGEIVHLSANHGAIVYAVFS